MEVKKFECCEKCGKDNCLVPCHKFINSKENDQLDKEFFNHNFRSIAEMRKAATEAEIRFNHLKHEASKKAELNKNLEFEDNAGTNIGEVIQVTGDFIAVKCNYIKTISFRDIFTKDVILE